MVQVFGNRILGGIGVPGGGMSESFGAGVNTALNQRTSRQAMVGEGQRQRMLEQEFAWRGEDREEAKRRQAAAAAAAASNRARAAGLRTTYESIYGTGPGGSTAAGSSFSATSGAAVTPSSRDGAPAGRPPAAVRTKQTGRYVEPGLTFGRGVEAPISGGAGGDVSGGAGSDILGAGVRAPTTMLGAQGFERRTGLPADLGAYLGGTAARPAPPAAPSAVGEPVFSDVFGALAVDGQGNLLVDNKVMLPSDPMYPAARRAYVSLQQRQVLAAEQAVQSAGASPLAYADPLGYRTGVAGAQQALLGAQAAVEAAPNEYARFAGRSDAPVGRLPAAPPVTIQGPNGPVTAPAVAAPASGTVNVAMPDGSVLPLSLGTEVPVEPTQLGFGPKLGAAPETRDEIALMEFASATGYDPNAPVPPPMKQPGAPNRAINRLMEERGKLVQWTQALIDAEQYEDAATAQAELANIDSKLEASIGRLAIQEARDFNAPQRLGAVWSDVEGRQYEFVPVAPGVFDIYVDGQPQFPGVSIEQIAESTLAMTDQVYAGRQAELAMLTETERAKGMGQAEANVFEYGQKAGIDVQKALQVGLTEIDLMAMKRDLGFGDKDQIDFEKDDQTGIIIVFRNGVQEAQYRPTTIAPEGAEPYVSFQRLD